MYILLILLMLASWLIQWRLRSKFKQYSQVGLSSGLSGAEIAKKMLTDHYNPTDKTVNLSEGVYAERSAAAAAIAAHECGHAVQHSTSYAMLQFRSALVPTLSAMSKWIPMLILAGFFLINRTPLPLLLGIGLFGLTTLFSFITLPVEFDASRRALAWMDQRGVVTTQEHSMAKDALWWAAMTYVLAALASLASLLYYASIFMRRR